MERVECPICGSEIVTHYDSHYECDSCGKQWTQVNVKKRKPKES